VSIVAAPTEYKNPFAPPAPAPAPVETAPVEATPIAEAPVAAPVASAVPAVEAFPAPALAVAESQAPVVESEPVEPPAVEPKAELNILPPETPRRVEQNWESQSFRDAASQPNSQPVRSEESQSGGQRPPRDDRRGDRPYFRSERERRNDRPYESRAPRGDSNPQEPVSDSEPSQSKPAPAPEVAKKSGGLFGWVKNLFGNSQPEAPKPEVRPEAPDQREGNPEGPYRRRRHRGGRNRGGFQGDQRGPRDGQQGGGQPYGDQRNSGGDQRGYRGDQRGYRGGDQRGYRGGDQRGYRGGDQRGYRGGDQRGYDGQNRGQGNYRGGPEGGDGGYRGNGRPEGGPPPAAS
jgi:hypothetical protein